jgi:uncharacterized membrane protein YjjP (DUF1212 family)
MVKPIDSEALDVLLQFGALMLRSGNTAARTREWIEVMARKMGFDAVSVSLSMDSMTVTVGRSGEWATTMREIGAPGVNVSRIADLEALAKMAEPGQTPRDIAVKLEDTEATKPLYSGVQIATAVGVASGGFAFLNGAAGVEMIAAVIGGGIGQWMRSWMAHRRLNQYGAAALSAIAASGIFVLMAALGAACWVGARALPGRLHRLGPVSDSGVSADRRTIRPAAISNGRRRQPPGLWRNDPAGARSGSQYCHRNWRGRHHTAAAT